MCALRAQSTIELDSDTTKDEGKCAEMLKYPYPSQHVLEVVSVSKSEDTFSPLQHELHVMLHATHVVLQTLTNMPPLSKTLPLFTSKLCRE